MVGMLRCWDAEFIMSVRVGTRNLDVVEKCRAGRWSTRLARKMI